MGTSGSYPNVSLEDVRGVFTGLEEPSRPLTAGDVAAELECPVAVARDALSALAERNGVRSREVNGSETVWWRPRTSDSDEGAESTEFSAFVSAVRDYAIFRLNPDGTVANWNDGAQRIKGYSEEEIVGEHLSTFYTDADVADGVPAANLEAATTEGRIEDEGWRLRDDGSQFWAHVVITAVRDEAGELQGFTKVTQDMTERREYEQQLRQERDLVEQILHTAPIGIGVLDPDGRFVRANPRLLERHGIDQSDLEEYSLSELDVYDGTGEEIPRSMWPLTRVVETGEPVHGFQCQVEPPNGDRQWVSISAAHLDDREDDDRIIVTIDDVSEQKKRERQLRRERDQTEQLVRTAPIAIAVQNADGETNLANRRAQDALGLTEQEILDKPDDTGDWSLYDGSGTPISPEETPSARVLATGEPVLDEEIRVERPDGGRMVFHINAAPIFDAEGAIERVVTAGEDITELKRRERQLERRKTELETELSEVLGRISDAFYALDDEWRFTHLNDQAADLMQRSRAELLDEVIWEVFPDAASVYREYFERAMETQQPVTFEEYIDALDRWFEFNVYPSESGLSIYFHDVTERREYQQQLEASNERLEQFAYAASHDLQEPLRMVSSYLQLVERQYEDELDDDGKEYVEFAVDGAERMRAMIDGLLHYSRVESRGDPFEPVDLEQVVADVRADLTLQIQETAAELTVDELPTVDGDPDQLRQVFQNLLDNAIEYSGDEPPRIHVSAERGDEEWIVSVRDEGIGVRAEDTSVIFDVFESLHTHDEHAGTGIGLALCQRIVERHGGDIWVDSEPGEGSTFSFSLPAAAADGE